MKTIDVEKFNQQFHMIGNLADFLHFIGALSRQGHFDTYGLLYARAKV